MRIEMLQSHVEREDGKETVYRQGECYIVEDQVGQALIAAGKALTDEDAELARLEAAEAEEKRKADLAAQEQKASQEASQTSANSGTAEEGGQN
jgi:hypothetical protein